MIGFEHQAVGIAKVHFHQLGQIAEVGDDRDLRAVRAKRESQRVHGVVRYRNRRNLDVADDKPLPAADVLHPVQAFVGSFRKNAQNLGVRRLGQVHGGAPLAQHLRERPDMIAVFVGDDDAVEPVHLAADRGEAPQRFFFAKPRVHQQAGPLGFEQGAVARTSRSQDSDAQADTFPRRLGPENPKAHGIMTKYGGGVNEGKEEKTVESLGSRVFRDGQLFS